MAKALKPSLSTSGVRAGPTRVSETNVQPTTTATDDTRAANAVVEVLGEVRWNAAGCRGAAWTGWGDGCAESAAIVVLLPTCDPLATSKLAASLYLTCQDATVR